MPYHTLKPVAESDTRLTVSGHSTSTGSGPYSYVWGSASTAVSRSARSGTNTVNFFSKSATGKRAFSLVIVGYRLAYRRVPGAPNSKVKKYDRFGKPYYVQRTIRVAYSVPVYKKVYQKVPPTTLFPNTLNYYNELHTFPFGLGAEINGKRNGYTYWQKWTGNTSYEPAKVGYAPGNSSGTVTEKFGSRQRTTQLYNQANFNDAQFQALKTSMSNICVANLKSKIRGEAFNLGNFLVEIEGTAGLIISTVARIAQAIYHIKKGQLHKAAKAIFPSNQKELASDWLMFQFGVLPLLSDLDSMCKSLADKLERPAVYDYIDSVTRPMPSESFFTFPTGSADNPFRQFLLVNGGEVTVKYKARVRTERPGVRKLADLGLTNPAAVLWEAIPFSFMIDYLVGIGDWLQGLTDFQGQTVEFVTRTTVLKQYHRVSWTVHSADSKNNWKYTTGLGPRGRDFRCIIINREIISVPSFVSNRDTFPRLKNSITWKKLMNSLAILTLLRR